MRQRVTRVARLLIKRTHRGVDRYSSLPRMGLLAFTAVSTAFFHPTSIKRRALHLGFWHFVDQGMSEERAHLQNPAHSRWPRGGAKEVW